MRKYLLHFLLFISSHLFAQTNIYHPFPDTDAVWAVHDDWSHMGTCCDISEWDRSYIQSGDTIINNVQYNKLYLNEHWWEIPIPPASCGCDHGITSYTFVGGLRNDTLSKRVYYYDNANSQECLLYDFNISVGDSIQDWMTYCNNGTYYWKVTSIDSVLVGASYHKRFNINGGMMNDTSIIEGIGSLTGLLGPYYFFENGNQLVCVSVLNQTVFINPNSFYSCGVVGVNELNNYAAISISPNPSSGTFSVKCSDEKINSLEVYSVLGEKIYETVKSSIDLSEKPKGIYFVRIKLGGTSTPLRVTTKKIILK